jgi:hypothetical protein
MKRWWHPKVCSALVFCAAMATLVSVWRIDSAGRGAVGRTGGCKVADLRGKAVELEMARSPARVLEILGRSEDSAEATRGSWDSDAEGKGRCLRDGVKAQTHGDNWLLFAYSGLTLALFLFVGSLRFPVPEGERPVRWAAFAFLGLLFALAMGAADFAENQRLFHLIELAGQAHLPPDEVIAAVLPGLRDLSGVKLGALALSAVLLGLLWPSAGARWITWPARILAGGAAILLGVALYSNDASKAICGVAVLTGFWLVALIHAVAVAISHEAASAPSPPAAAKANIPPRAEERR